MLPVLVGLQLIGGNLFVVLAPHRASGVGVEWCVETCWLVVLSGSFI